jgi:hypothetical protein
MLNNFEGGEGNVDLGGGGRGGRVFVQGKLDKRFMMLRLPTEGSPIR